MHTYHILAKLYITYPNSHSLWILSDILNGATMSLQRANDFCKGSTKKLYKTRIHTNKQKYIFKEQGSIKQNRISKNKLYSHHFTMHS